jgi:sn-glycerol 3-phosphate transport system substrate-binding protein
MTSLRRCSALVVVLLLIATACGGDDDDAGGDGGGGGSDVASQCPIGAIEEQAAAEPVEITYWHSMQEDNARLLGEIANDFNTAQTDVRVELVNQTSYADTLTAFRAAYGSGDSPDLVQLEDKETQQMIDSQAVVPAQACVDADDYDLSDHLTRVIDYFTVEGQLWPMPFNVSNPVLYYNRAAFTAAGIDPDDPPATLDEVRDAAQTIVDSGTTPYGWALKLDPWFLELWTAMAGEPYVDNGNGREGRATEVAFDNDAGRSVYEWIADMVDSGLAENTGRPEGNINHYLAVGNKTSAMTADTSAAIGIALPLLNSGQFPGVELGVAPLPGLPGDGATFVGGGANYIVKGDSPEKIEAAWRFAQYLNEPEVQAKWAQTGYIPIRESAVELAPVQELWAGTPAYRVAYDQLASDNQTVAAKGPVIGDFAGVKNAVIDSLEQMLTNGVPPDDALADAKENADAAITEYNERAG